MNRTEELKELRKLWSGFWSSRVVITANNLQIFDHLEESAPADAVAAALSADLRAVTILLDALTALGLVKKNGRNYRNSDISRSFLVTGAPDYQGDMIRHADILWRNWSSLDDIVKTGAPARQAANHESFIRAMHNNSRLKAGKIVGLLDLAGVRRALDLGGGPGTYSIELAKRGIEVTLFDLPETAPIARDIIGATGLKVDVRSGDVFKDDLGEGYDLVFISQVLHSFSPEDNVRILEKCREALQPEGRIIIQEFLIDKTMTSPPFGALFSVNMLVNTTGGRCYPASELGQLLKKAGFQNPADTVFEDSSLVIASAPAKR